MRARLLVLSTVGTAEDAARLAQALVEASLAACVNVVPGVTSTYRWKGEVHRDAEHLLLVKTRAERLAALQAELLRLHPYEVPEVVAVPIACGHAAYLRWLDGEVRPPRTAATRRRTPARGRRSGRRRPRSRR